MPNQHGQPVIAIDGTSASGKSSVAEKVAQMYGAILLEGGIFYRIITAHMLKLEDASLRLDPKAKTLDPAQQEEALKFARTLDWPTVNAAKENPHFRGPLVSGNVAKISSVEAIHACVDDVLRNLINESDDRPVVIEGRTIGKYVFPAADVKLFTDADVRVRGKRRAQSQRAQGHDISDLEAAKQLAARDYFDAVRKYEPVYFDPTVHSKLNTTYVTMPDTVSIALGLIEAKVPSMKARREETTARILQALTPEVAEMAPHTWSSNRPQHNSWVSDSATPGSDKTAFQRQ